MQVTTYNAFLRTSEQTGTADAVNDWLGDTSFQIIGIKIQPETVDITIRGDGQVPPLAGLHEKLNILYGHPTKINLHVTPYQSQSFPESADKTWSFAINIISWVRAPDHGLNKIRVKCYYHP